MGLLGKLVGAGACLIGAGAETIGKKIDNAFVKQEQKNLEYLSNYPYSHKYLIRKVKHTMDDMSYVKEVGIEGDVFTVFNVNNEPTYFARNAHSPRKQRYEVMDMHYSEIAVIECKKAILSSDKRTCDIYMGDNRFTLSSNVIFDKRKFSISDDSIKIKANETSKEIKIYWEGNVIIQINKVSSDLGVKWGEYVVGCNDKENELLTILLGIAIGIMLMKSENILDEK